MGAVFARFGADLPGLGGIYLAAFGGRAGDVGADDRSRYRGDVGAPKIDAALVCIMSCPWSTGSSSSWCSPRFRGCWGRGGWLITPRRRPSWTPWLMPGALPGCPPPPSTGALWKSLADNQTDGVPRQVTFDSGLEAMTDEVAIRPSRSITGPHTPARTTIVAADWTRSGHRLPHPHTPTHHRPPPTHRHHRRQTTGGDVAWDGMESIGELDPLDAERVIAERLCSRLATIMGYADPSGESEPPYR